MKKKNHKINRESVPLGGNTWLIRKISPTEITPRHTLIHQLEIIMIYVSQHADGNVNYNPLLLFTHKITHTSVSVGQLFLSVYNSGHPHLSNALHQALMIQISEWRLFKPLVAGTITLEQKKYLQTCSCFEVWIIVCKMLPLNSRKRLQGIYCSMAAVSVG